VQEGFVHHSHFPAIQAPCLGHEFDYVIVFMAAIMTLPPKAGELLHRIGCRVWSPNARVCTGWRVER
jgi:hypothetical protein